MTEELILHLSRETLKVTGMIAGPMLMGALIIGLGVSVLQAITQINEATLTFIPKMVVVALIFLLAGPWMLDVLGTYTISLFSDFASFVRGS